MTQTAYTNLSESLYGPGRAPLDRRKHPRFRAGSMIRFPDAELFGFVDTTTEDVSCGGFSFLTRIPYTPAAGFYCNLMLPDRGTGKLALQCRARVISTASRRQGLY